MKAITIDTRKNKLDPRFITDFIANSYWDKGRSIIEQTQKALKTL